MLDDEIVFSGKCPHCFEKVAFRTKHHHVYDGHSAAFLAFCCGCGKPVLGTGMKTKEKTIVIKIFPELRVYKPAEQLTQVLKERYADIAQLIYIPEQSHSIIMMVRSFLQSIAKDKGFAKGKLDNQINDMLTANAIPASLKDVAHLIRVIGNESTHEFEENITYEEAMEVFEFLNLIIEYVYVLPARIDALKAKRNSK